MDAEICNPQLCRICITSHTNSMQMISIFGEDSLWQKITTLADVKITKNDTLPQQVCVTCAKTAISACLFKKKCEDADNFYRQQLLIKKIEGHGGELLPGQDIKGEAQAGEPKSSSSSASGSSSSSSSSSSSDDDEEEEEDNDNDNDNDSDVGNVASIHQQNGHAVNGQLTEAAGQVADLPHSGHDEPNDDDDDGEISGDAHAKEPFDFNSIRLMQEYMQRQMNKFPNGEAAASEAGSEAGLGNGDGDGEAEDDETLPLIPEIELITPSDEPMAMLGAGGAVGEAAGAPVAGGGVRGFQCPHCYQIFEMKQILKAHMQSVHGAPGPVYECTNCRKTYFYKRFLEKHIRRGRCVKKRRNQTRPMQCSDCHVLFPTGHHLGWHKRTGCPSKAAKMPLQQLFKQNIVQFNNFSKRIGGSPRKPPPADNGVHVNNNRKLGLANNKRKGRTRIKLDAKKIALAKQLILREATTTVIANELNISRTFAWRLRKSLVNGVSLHERVVDQASEEHLQQQPPPLAPPSDDDGPERLQHQHQQQQLSLSYPHLGLGLIKEEQQDSDDDEQGTLTIADECVAEIGAEETAGYAGADDDVCGLLHNGYDARAQLDEGIDGPEACHGNENERNSPLPPPPARADVEAYKRLLAESQCFPHIVNAQQLQLQQQQKSAATHNGGLPMLTRYAPANHAVPVNLSIRSMPQMNSNESNGSTSSNATAAAPSAQSHQQTGKKPRKPNVFIDDEKYAMAKLLVAQNSSTMEIARALNVSQMTAWKVRDAILKGVPLSYRNKRVEGRSNSAAEEAAKEQQLHLQQQQQQQQQELHELQRQQQLQEMHQQQLELLKQKQKQRQQQELLLQQQQQQLRHTPADTSHYQQQPQPQPAQQPAKLVHPRRRLKAAERELRDKEITREILELIKEDSNIQYWKVSARLAEKGINISPSSVCQKLKSMGIHRRWKPGDKPPMPAMSQLKAATVAVATLAASNGANFALANGVPGIVADDVYDQQQFDMGGPHFLSAFTR